MKDLFFGLALTVVLYSCDNTIKNRTQDQIVNQQLKANQAENDSLAQVNQAKNDSLAQIAWGDSKFGMSLKEIKETEAFAEATQLLIKDSIEAWWIHSFRKTKVENIDRITAYFFKDRLYLVKLESDAKNANYYNTYIEETVLHLKDLIESKYGPPTMTNGFPDFMKMSPSISIEAYLWEIGVKSITILVSELSSGSEYKVECIIVNNKEAEPVKEYISKQSEEKKSKQVNRF